MSNIVRFDGIRSLGFGSISSSYAALGTQFGHAMRVLHFINNTDTDILVSFDGSNDNTIVLAEGFALYDLTSDQDIAEHFRYQKGTQIYIKDTGTAATLGSFYLVCVYGKGE